MSELTAQEVARLREERNLNNDQIAVLQRAVRQYHSKVSKE
jgi:hypothetical protein